MEKRKVFVQGIKKVGPFTNRETGEIVEGYQAHYTDLNKVDKDNNLGYLPSKKFLSVQDGEQMLRTGIGIYNLLISIDLLSSRPRINVDGFEFIKPLELDLAK